MPDKRTFNLITALLIACTALSLSSTALSAVPFQALRAGQDLLEQGDAAKALEHFQELQVDYPDVGEVRFGLGCAWYMKAEQQLETGAVPEALASYAEARTAFDALLSNDNALVAREAAFNRANCLAREAAAVNPSEYEEAKAALRRAVEAYETGLERYPDHAGMKQNLEHLRFLLKQLLQNPPEQEPQNEEKEPPDQPPPSILSRFGAVSTQLPGAQTKQEDNTAILIMPDASEARP